nr:hypothetical protein [uncultured Chitinophaga sp.]
MRKNLILGLSANYDWPVLRNFVCSLRQTTYTGDLVLFMSPAPDQSTKDMLTQHGVTCFVVDSSSPYLKGLPADVYNDPSFFPKLPPSVYRMLVFYNFLQENRADYQHVLLTDVRDVVFQNDPFAFDIADKMCFFMESKSLLLKESDWNSLWMIAAFGVKTLYDLGENLISCVGTVIGPVAKMIVYLEKMVHHLKNAEVYLMFGIEQAVHNYMIMNGEVDDFHTFYTENGPVATLSSYGEVQQDENGSYLNDGNMVSLVVHQYDRHPVLKSHYDRIYN